MIRTSKSFGINNILLSDEITDVYNPNVIRASIGHYLIQIYLVEVMMK